jgi:hypothetical protein
MSFDASNLPFFASIGSLIVAILTFLWARFKEGADIKERISSLEQTRVDSKADCERLKCLEDKVSVNTDRLVCLETKMELFWNAMTSNAVKALHHPKEFKTDHLLEKLEAKTITPTEMEKLKEELNCRIKDTKNNKREEEIFWASFILARIDVLLQDYKGLKMK